MLDEIVSISVNLRLDKARECLNDAEQQIALSSFASSANRSYYCIFHSLNAVLTTVGFSSQKHLGCISEFRRRFVKSGVFSNQHSDIIGEAFKVRTKSDYDIHYVIAKADVIKQFENAKIFLAAVEDYIKAL